MTSCFSRMVSAFCRATSTTKSVSVFSEYAAARSSRRLACGLRRRLMRSGRWAVRDIEMILIHLLYVKQTYRSRPPRRKRPLCGRRLGLLRHQAFAAERLLHARAAGLVVLGVLVDVPDVVDARAGQDVLRRQHGGHHGVVLVVVFVHAVAPDHVQARIEAFEVTPDDRGVLAIVSVTH